VSERCVAPVRGRRQPLIAPDEELLIAARQALGDPETAEHLRRTRPLASGCSVCAPSATAHARVATSVAPEPGCRPPGPPHRQSHPIAKHFAAPARLTTPADDLADRHRTGRQRGPPANPPAETHFFRSLLARLAATCVDNSTQAEAQRAADKRDADGDSVYCETMPCPCLQPGDDDGGGTGGGDDDAAEDRSASGRQQVAAGRRLAAELPLVRRAQAKTRRYKRFDGSEWRITNLVDADAIKATKRGCCVRGPGVHGPRDPGPMRGGRGRLYFMAYGP
jgi:hypothetical protein